MNQKEIFLNKEGDAYFKRNIESKELVYKPNPPFLCIEKYLKKDMKVLEIGCAAGKNLNYFNKEYGCEVYGIEPSSKAVKKGIKMYQNINLKVGTSDKLDFSDEYFDFVYFGCCLYLVDRTLLFKSISEADRVLKNNGYLAIVDFDSKMPIKRKYKHLEGIFSYKYDYSKLFLSSPHYYLVEKKVFNYIENPFNRQSTSVLYKRISDAYYFQEDK